VLKAISDALSHLNRYPDGGALPSGGSGPASRPHPEHIIMGNGSSELIELIVRSFPPGGRSGHPPSVVRRLPDDRAGGGRYPGGGDLKDHRLISRRWPAHHPMTKMVFIANPNNPTATVVTAEEVAAFMARVPDKVVVVFDEAYFEFAQGPDFPDSLQYMKQGRKVAILRTFSKAASLAGLRVGYAVADPDCIALLNRIRAPFNVNSLAQVAALAALEDDSHILECLRMNEAGRHFLCEEFTAMGIKYVPSRANFVLVDVGRSGSDIFQRLLKEGVIVRPMSSFGMETALRVTIGTPEENRRLIKALKKVLGEGKAG
jgi:histidinol-phosphate aminotransferase